MMELVIASDMSLIMHPLNVRKSNKGYITSCDYLVVTNLREVMVPCR